MIETTKLHCINNCHGNTKMKSHNLPIVIYRANTAESLDIFIVVPQVLLNLYPTEAILHRHLQCNWGEPEQAPH